MSAKLVPFQESTERPYMITAEPSTVYVIKGNNVNNVIYQKNAFTKRLTKPST